MSLGGLAVAIGIIIDDAVVVVENIERRLALHPDEPPAEVVRTGTDEILGPVAGSTLTTVVVFAPLGLLTGVVGEFFRSFAHRARGGGAALARAGDDADPGGGGAVGARAEPRAARRRRGRWIPRLPLARAGGALRPGDRLDARAPRRWRSARAWRCCALGLGLTRVIGTGFLPEMDEGGFILDYWAPTGAALSETDRQVRVLERILLADPDVQAFTRRTGSELGFAATSPNTRRLHRAAQAARAASASVYEVMDRVRAAAEERAPAVRVEFVQLMQDVIGDLAGAPEPVELKLFSRDQAAGRAGGAGGGARRSSRRPGWWTCSTACRAPTPSAGSSSIRRASRGWGSRPAEVAGPGARGAVRRRGRHRAGARPAGADPGAAARQRALPAAT